MKYPIPRPLKHALKLWNYKMDYYVRKLSKHDSPLETFSTELKRLLEVDDAWLQDAYKSYSRVKHQFEYLLPVTKSQSRKTDRACKSMDPCEAFAFWAVIQKLQLRNILELGTNLGVSALFLSTALRSLFGKDGHLYSCDLNRDYCYVNDRDFTFIHSDAAKLFPGFLKEHSVDCVFNDVHPYDLTKLSVEFSMTAKMPVIAFHDVGQNHRRGPFKKEFYPSRLKLKDHSPDIYPYGHWERHIMIDSFGDKLLDENYTETDEYKVQIFDSLFGLGIAIRKDSLKKN